MKVVIGPYPDDGSERTVYVSIEDFDTWSMDYDLALIILPMLKQLKETKHGSPHVDIEDVPPEYQLNGTASNESAQYDLFPSDEHDNMVWDAMHARWDWVLDEMIFAFECLAGEHQVWEDQFWTGESDIYWKELLNGLSEMKYGPNHTRVWDKEGYTRWANRMDNGFRLFGKYYRGLWN